ncbi:hypothetical protein BJ970_006355 [Saccharopolyspora phatthalungensis]|uniref:Uncharacterized protein n=1 Tax=Saccharopolyspora phatthalungensis TaxID=664693 RepID=A0A840QEA1_9PSEU|nr:hypothetical protein [Saccharopolyspora phatthalungensis]
MTSVIHLPGREAEIGDAVSSPAPVDTFAGAPVTEGIS